MKRTVRFLTYFALVFLAGFLFFKISMFHYEKTAENRVAKVIEYQDTYISKAIVEFDGFDYKNGWSKMVYYDEDPEIRYEYVYDRAENLDVIIICHST